MRVGSFACSKVALCMLNMLYIVVAIMLISMAAYFKAAAIIETTTMMGGVLVCGSLLMLVAIIGLIGAIRHHQVMLFFYMIILFVLFLVQFALACACLALSGSQQRQVLKLGWARASSELKHDMQIQFNCCGFDNGTIDLPVTDPMGHPPCSQAACCTSQKMLRPDLLTSTTEPPCSVCHPCLDRAEPYLDKAVKTIGGLGLVFSLTELFGVWLTIKYRNQKDPSANPSAFL